MCMCDGKKCERREKNAYAKKVCRYTDMRDTSISLFSNMVIPPNHKSLIEASSRDCKWRPKRSRRLREGQEHEDRDEVDIFGVISGIAGRR